MRRSWPGWRPRDARWRNSSRAPSASWARTWRSAGPGTRRTRWPRRSAFSCRWSRCRPARCGAQPGQARHVPAEAWLGEPLAAQPDAEILVRRYLTAFGPATIADLQRWSGRARLGETVRRLRPELALFRDEQGRELLDLPEAPRPGPDTPAPARLVAEFDNLLLGHADRTRVISDPHRRRLGTVNAVIPGAVLVDGFVIGSWRITAPGETATLTIRPFEPVPRAAFAALEAEGQRLLEFARPAAGSRDVLFEPVTG